MLWLANLIGWLKDLPWKVIGYVALILVIAFAGWTFRGHLADRDIAELKLEWEQERLSIARKQSEEIGKVLEREHILQDALGIQEAQHYNALQELQHENTNLRNRVADGSVGLRVAAKCSTTSAPQSGSSTSVDTGKGAELDPAARSAYHALREGIVRVQEKLSACQERLETIERAMR